MKSKIFSLPLRASSLLFLLAAFLPAKACGPYIPRIPSPNFFTSKDAGKTRKAVERELNLRRWQRLTAENIPLADIEQAVYKDSYKKIYGIHNNPGVHTDNKFYAFLLNTEDWEVFRFLLLAKGLEELRAEHASPWYYPKTREENASYENRPVYTWEYDFPDEIANNPKKHDDIRYFIARIKEYHGTRLRDRYGLQMVRALFTLRQYDKCVEYFDSAFAEIPDSNLFKRMALDYVAGCWMRLGRTEKANGYFAKTGSFLSLRADNPVGYMAEKNPDALELLEHLQHCASDSATMCRLKPVCEKVLREGKARKRGDWEFALAYIAGQYHNDYPAAGKHISKALQSSFSSNNLRDHARAYRAKCDAANGISSRLLSDLKWFERKTDPAEADAGEWNRMLQNIVYVHWVPRLWKEKDYATAILLCGYADNMFLSKNLFSASERRNDYGSLSFQLMGSLQFAQFTATYRKIKSGNPLYSHLKKYARTDRDYMYELAGTLALREENYRAAIAYFSRVSGGYQKTLNVYSYLRRNPFLAYPNRYIENNDRDPQWEYRWLDADREENQLKPTCQVKLMFASKMYRYQKAMREGKTGDERGLARLKYAIGRRNSFEECWALTQYWKGCAISLFYPDTWDDSLGDVYGFLYDYEQKTGHKKTEMLYYSECSKAMAMLHSDEAKAEAEYMFCHRRKIIRAYPNTSTARKIKTSCDSWKMWL